MSLITLELEKQQRIKDKIKRLEVLLEKTKVNKFLLENKKPQLIIADRCLGKYQYLTERIIINKLNITLFPVWLSIPCTHPSWSQDIMMVNLIYEDTIEILIDGLYQTFQCSYSECRRLIVDYGLLIPIFCSMDYLSGTNIIVNFENSQEISALEHKKKNFCLRTILDDNNMMITTAKVKFVLIT